MQMTVTSPIRALGVRAALTGVMLVALAPGLGAQSASDIVGRMLDEYARRAERVDDYTLVQQVMGFETVSYFEKEMVDGRPVFRLRGGTTAGTARRPPDEDIVARDDQHDDNRIGAGEMEGAAGGADPTPARVSHLTLVAAF